jgi:hypothetical protein
MIDLTREEPLPLAAAAALIPPARRGKRTALSTMLRWVLSGVRLPSGGVVRLEAIRLGGRWMTSRSALQRFAVAQTPRLDGNDETAPTPLSGRRQASERAASKLESVGI